MSNIRKYTTRSGALLAGVALSAAGVAVTASPAEASAYGCSWFGGGMSSGKPFYKGSYCVHLGGGGTYVDRVVGGASAYGTICNASITAEFYDASDRVYRTYTSPTNYSCGPGYSQSIYISSTMRSGKMCSTLRQNGVRLTSVCHGIHP